MRAGITPEEERPVPRGGQFASLASTIVSTLFIAWMTLRPSVGSPDLPFWCILCGSLGLVDFLLNVALFLPLGLCLANLTRRRALPIAIGFAVTLVVEFLQWRLIPGRDASLGDLLSNTLGTALGAGIRFFVPWASAARGRLAQSLAWGSAAATTLLLIASSWLLAPLPVRYPLAVQWAPIRPYMDRFLGTILDASFNDRELREFEVLRGDGVTRSGVSLEASLTVPSVTTRLPAHVLRLAWGPYEGAMLGQRRGDLTFRASQRAAAWLLRPLLVRLPAALPDSNPGSEVRVVALSTAAGLALSQTRSGSTPRAAWLPRTPGLGWTLVLPRETPLGKEARFFSAIWLMLLVLPAAFLVEGAGTEIGLRAAGPLVLLLASMPVAAFLASGSQPSLVEWLGLGAGIAFGIGLRRLTRRRTNRQA